LAKKHPHKINSKKGKSMEKKMMRIGGIVGLILVIISLMVIGCQQQASPPASAPPAPAPSASATPPAGTAQTAPAGTPAQDPNQLQMGMAATQVQQIMGAPAQTKQKGAITEWKYFTPQGKVEVQIQNNQVVGIERH
jgi:hypothetical protein